MRFKLLSFLFKKNYFSACVLITVFFAVGATAHAVTILPRNAATDETVGSLRTIYFPVQDTGAGGCVGVSTYPTTLSPLVPTFNPASDAGVMYFDIIPTKTLDEINGGITPTLNTDVSVRVELDSDSTTAIAVVPIAGLGYSDTTQAYAAYGTTVATRTFGISLPKRVLAGTSGFCDIMTAEKSYSADCQRDSTSTALPLNLKIGLIKTTSVQFSSDANSDYTTVNINISQCPPGINNVPNPSIQAEAGDEKVKVSLPTPVTGIDTQTPVKSVVLFASPSTSFPGLSAEISSGFNTSTGTGVFDFPGLANETQYCFSVGYVNKGGFISTPVPTAGNATCATPSKIEGFLNRSTCFIATATYADEWDLRLEVLRQFRDQLLLQNSLGKKFVNWYYDWSPEAAHWIIENQKIRPFFEAALYPVVQAAKAILYLKRHIGVLGGLVLALLAIFAVVFVRASARRKAAIVVSCFLFFLLPSFLYAADQAKPAVSQTAPNATQPTTPNLNVKSPMAVQPYIESLKAGHELEPKKRGTVKQAAGFGVVTVSKFDVTSDQVQANSFDSVYNPNEKYALGFDFFYERHLFRNHYIGALGPSVRAGLVSLKGHGIFTSRRYSSDDVYVRFFAVPISVGASYRFLQGRFIQPYAQFYAVGIPILETRTDGKPNRRALARGYNAVGGVALSLDWIARKNAWDLYDAHGILHSYFTVQYEMLQSVASSVSFKYSGVYVGFLFEF